MLWTYNNTQFNPTELYPWSMCVAFPNQYLTNVDFYTHTSYKNEIHGQRVTINLWHENGGNHWLSTNIVALFHLLCINMEFSTSWYARVTCTASSSRCGVRRKILHRTAHLFSFGLKCLLRFSARSWYLRVAVKLWHICCACRKIKQIFVKRGLKC